jgi:hypothetical protein
MVNRTGGTSVAAVETRHIHKRHPALNACPG